MGNRSVLITGATGFIGRHLVHRLVDLGWDVHALLKSTSDRTRLNCIPDVNLHVYDGSIETIQGALKICQPDIIYHLATYYIPHHESDDLQAMIDANISLGAQLLEAMALEKVGLLVNAGTSWQNFQDAVYRPVNLYAAMKQAFEDLLAYYVDAFDLRAVTLRLFDTYGPDDTRDKLLNTLKAAAQNGNVLRMSPGGQQVNLLHIIDIIEGFIKAGSYAENMPEPHHKVFVLASNEQISLKELVALFSSLTKKPINIEWGGLPYRPREVMVPWTQGIVLPDWSQTISLKEGLKHLLEGS